ncbi:ABC transporter ATP-binding protein [Enorma phocaeensis]|uniref:ABC transporter ATP-binding protein n=1 Tax=Enorma phocaeensis TaxID=1871019 RepID=UPI002357DE39|nr:ABC transporter ATP-binding protein [Enorma phocaeensis]
MPNTSAPAICVRGLTKDYGRGRGVFDVNLEVDAGEVLGFLGPNGAGKTVTMRHLMGFVRPQRGTAEILGHNCFWERPQVQVSLGYLPGENACMKEMAARSFLDLLAEMRGMRDHARMMELVDVFGLDLGARIGGMSKGNRQKVAIVAAFMARPDVLLLDEPTSGLDPLMQERFLDLVEEERARGAAILLSSHIFEEVGRACDRVAFIRAGRVVMTCTMDEVRSMRGRGYTVEFANVRERTRWELAHGNESANGSDRAVELRDVRDVNALIRELSSYDVAEVTSRAQTLEELFLHLYEGDELSGQK